MNVLFLACSRLSDSGEDAKVKGTRKVGGEKLFSSSRFLNSTGPTISEPGQASFFLPGNLEATEATMCILRNVSSFFPLIYHLSAVRNLQYGLRKPGQ